MVALSVVVMVEHWVASMAVMTVWLDLMTVVDWAESRVETKDETSVRLLVVSLAPLWDERLVVAMVVLSAVLTDWSGYWMVDTMVAYSGGEMVEMRIICET